jgi:hypothetical protein
MKKALIIFMMILSGAIHGQTERYSYKIKLEGINNADTAKYPADYLSLLFKVEPIFNDSLKQFEFISPMCIIEHGFISLMKDEGYHMIYFDKEPYLKQRAK